MAARLLDRTLLERVGHKVVEMCGPLAFISRLSHLYVVDGLVDGGRALENRGRHLRTVH